jgi:hypothetical protein
MQLQGKKLPQVFKQQAKNLEKLKQEKNQYKNAISQIQKEREFQLEQKKLQILQE